MMSGEDCVMSNERLIKLAPTNTPNYQIYSSNKFITAQIMQLHQSWPQIPPPHSEDEFGESETFYRPRVADPRTKSLSGDPPTYFPILLRGFYPPTKFTQIAFGAGILSEIGEGRTKQKEGFEC